MSGELPEGWARAPLREIAWLQSGLAKGKKRKPGTAARTVPYLRVKNVQRGRLNLEEVAEIEATEGEIEKLLLMKGDILLNEGGDRDKLGRGTVWQAELPVCIHQNHVFRARLPQDGPLPIFVSSYTNHEEAQRYFLSKGKQTTNLASINMTVLGELEIPLPPLNEQKRIVAKVDALTEKSREARHALDEVPALLDQLRQSILAAAFRGDLTKKWREQNPNVEPASVLLDRIRQERRRKWEEAELAKFQAKGKIPTDDKWKAKYKEPEPVDTEGLPELPEGWCWSSINELTLMSGGITKGQQRKAEVRTRPVPYLRVANVQRGSLSLEELAEIEATDEQIEQLRLQPGDLLLNEGGDIDKLGRGWVWRGELETCIHQNHVFRARPVSRDLDPEFISHFTNTFGQRYFLDSGKQTTNLASVSMTRVKACPVPVAPVAETKAVVTAIRDTLKSAQSVISIHSASTEHLETLDASILAKAFRGELVPQDPNDEPAFVLLERIRKERGGEAPNKNGRKNKGKGRSPAL